jgi:hypothetical protein
MTKVLLLELLFQRQNCSSKIRWAKTYILLHKNSVWSGLSIYSKNLVFAVKNLGSGQKLSFQAETLVMRMHLA